MAERRYCYIQMPATINVAIDVEEFVQSTGLKPTKQNLMEFAAGHWGDGIRTDVYQTSVARHYVGDTFEIDAPAKKVKVRKGIGSY